MSFELLDFVLPVVVISSNHFYLLHLRLVIVALRLDCLQSFTKIPEEHLEIFAFVANSRVTMLPGRKNFVAILLEGEIMKVGKRMSENKIFVK